MRQIVGMPIIERDPWRMQYFEGVSCPDAVEIPTEESDAYRLFPKHRWVFNKLTVAESQGIVCGLHGIDPPSFPVFSKPVYNMRGMGAGSRVLRTPEGYERYNKPGHFWMELLEGEHVSSDVAVVDGEPVWWRHVVGKPIGQGKFDYWTVSAASNPAVESYCTEWIRENMKGYSGMMNLETIGARIIEVHLRFADQWPDLYGRGWLDALVKLYAEGRWDYADDDRRDGYSVVLFGMHEVAYQHPNPEVIEAIRAWAQVSSVQVTFHADKPSWAHSMPPGGFRLAIINTWDLDVGVRARQELALAFWAAQGLLPKGAKRARAAEAR